MAEINLDRSIFNDYSPNTQRFEADGADFASYVDSKTITDNHNLLKIVFGEIFNDWEKHRGICCMTHSSFAKHLISIHEKCCSTYVYNSNLETVNLPLLQGSHQTVQTPCTDIVSNTNSIEVGRSQNVAGVTVTVSDNNEVKRLIAANYPNITTICMPEWDSTSSNTGYTATDVPKNTIQTVQYIKQQDADSVQQQLELLEAPVVKKIVIKPVEKTNSMCQTSDNDDDDFENLSISDDGKSEISRKKKLKEGEKEAAGRVKRKYVRKTPLKPKKV